MQIEKKLVLCSILAISIGIAAIAPLAFFMSTTKAQTTNDVPWFNIEVPFAYYGTDSTEGITTHVGNFSYYGVTSYSSSYHVGLNYTVNPEITHFENARIEYYNLHVYSDIGHITDIMTSFGANCTGYINPGASFNFALNNWFNTSISSGGTFIGHFNGTLISDIDHINGVGGSSSSSVLANVSLPVGFLNAQNANIIYIDLSRLGYVTFEGNNTIVTLADNTIIQHIELTKNADKFMFGDVPVDRMLSSFPKSEYYPYLP